jgi:hypothetical protein
MKRGSTIFLQVVIVLIGIGVLAFMLGMPHLEGRNKNATVFEIYFKDPFLAYAYTGSIAFFVALYQAFKLLGCVARNEVFSQRSVKALRTIKILRADLGRFSGGSGSLLLHRDARKGGGHCRRSHDGSYADFYRHRHRHRGGRV